MVPISSYVWYITHIGIEFFKVQSMTRYILLIKYEKQSVFSLRCSLCLDKYAGIIIGMGSTNERRRYIITSFLIG